jgi:uncharacterized protein (TIGR03437 family)
LTIRKLALLTLFVSAASGQNVVLPGRVHPRALPQFDQGPLAASTPMTGLTLYLKPAPGLEGFLRELQTPSSPDYHRFLTPDEFGARFGLNSADMNRVAAWLTSQGLTVENVARGRHWITFHGNAGAVGNAFHTAIHRFVVDGERHIANISDPSIPAELSGMIAGVHGLHDFRPKSLTVRSNLRPDYNIAGQHYLAPDDFATIYDLQPVYASGLDGTGQSIAIIGAAHISVSDINSFRRTFKLPTLNLQQVVVGADPGQNSEALLEADLDIEWAGAVARNAAIYYVYGADVYAAGQQAVDQNLAPVISFSFGDCETGPVPAFRSVVQEANALGITWVAASGDGAAATCDYQSSPTTQATKGAAVSFPASIPEVTAVGGTEFNEGSANLWASSNSNTLSSALSYIPEVVWNESSLMNSLLGGGGGASALFSKPLWQNAPGVPADGARDVPDLAFNAAVNHDPYLVTSGGQQYLVGGTSAAAPAFAGIVALLNQKIGNPKGLGNVNPALYTMARTTTDVFHDILTGNNRVPCQQGTLGCVNGLVGFAAGPGYDQASGLGSADAAKLIAEWNSGKASTTTVSAPASASLSDPLNLVATVAGSGGGPVPTGTVTFLANDLELGEAKVNAAGAATLAATANQMPPGQNTVTAVYAGDSIYSSSSGTAGVTVNLPAAGAAVVPSVDPNPSYGQPNDANGPIWAYTVTLTEEAGVAATLTGFTIDGKAQSLRPFGSGAIKAKGSLTALINESGVATPAIRVMVFTGTDATGLTWTQRLSVPFIGPVIAPGIALTSSNSTVQLNAQNDPSCQYQHRLTVQELSGFQVSLYKLTAGADYSKQIQSLFGTTRLAPYGILQADFCMSGAASPGARNIQISGIAEDGSTVTANTIVTYASPAASAATPSVSSPTAQILANGGQGSTNLDLKFSGAPAAWNATLLPANRASSWLSVSPTSGTGPAHFTLTGTSSGLSNGVYNAILEIQFVNSIPPFIDVPVSMIVGASSDISVAGIANNASFTKGVAPGMQAAVFGVNLAPGTALAQTIPLPFSMLGVSATVNGISAPLYYVSAKQIDLQIPYETAQGTAVLAINNNGQVTSFTFPMSVVAPGAFNVFYDATTRSYGAGHAGDIMEMFISGDGDVTPTLATGAAPPSGTPVSNLSAPRMPLSVTVGNNPATVNFRGITTGLVGVTQINFTIPPNTPPGDLPVVVTVGPASTPPITLTVK